MGYEKTGPRLCRGPVLSSCVQEAVDSLPPLILTEGKRRPGPGESGPGAWDIG